MPSVGLSVPSVRLSVPSVGTCEGIDHTPLRLANEIAGLSRSLTEVRRLGKRLSGVRIDGCGRSEDHVNEETHLRDHENPRPLSCICDGEEHFAERRELADGFVVIEIGFVGKDVHDATDTGEICRCSGPVRDRGHRVHVGKLLGHRRACLGADGDRRHGDQAERDKPDDKGTGIPHGETHENGQAMRGPPVSASFVT